MGGCGRLSISGVRNDSSPPLLVAIVLRWCAKLVNHWLAMAVIDPVSVSTLTFVLKMYPTEKMKCKCKKGSMGFFRVNMNMTSTSPTPGGDISLISVLTFWKKTKKSDMSLPETVQRHSQNPLVAWR